MAATDIPKDKTEFRYFILEIIGTLTAMIEEKDPFLKKHSVRVADNSANFCEEFKIFDEEGIESIKVQYKILMDKLWGHSLACAYGAKLIAQNLKFEDPENFF